ncbi:biotin/lipoyl-containing protein, partial [Parasphingorhabdus sp.]|uniref:biotin/lipoyl-containing protein n=1 Tax=Parasphingorhabdus sp. TaxID=2709688 RepID=UPI0030020B2D
MAIEVTVPALGESITEATLGEWLKQPGDAVAADEPIASLETDKVALEVPAPQAGVMGAHQVAVGDTVEVGAVIATIEAGSGTAAKSAPAPAKEKSETKEAAKADEPDASITLSPSVRRLVLEHGVDPSKISGTGKDGRLTKADVEQYVQSGAQQPPLTEKGAASGAPAPSAPSPSGNRNEERVRMTRL